MIFVYGSKTSGHCLSPKEEKDFYILFRYFIFVRSVPSGVPNFQYRGIIAIDGHSTPKIIKSFAYHPDWILSSLFQATMSTLCTPSDHEITFIFICIFLRSL